MNLFRITSIDFWIELLYCVPAIIIGLCFHEFAHAFAAHCLGDDTAKNMGRMTINPVAHLDPIGAACMIFLGFGWAKPVPVNPNNYRGNKKVGDIIVSLAGIVMNFFIAFISLFILYFLCYVCKVRNDVIVAILMRVVYLNIGLMIFNLIPVPPLDGSHVLEDLLIPVVGAKPFYFLRQNSMIILVAVILILNTTNVLSTVMGGVTGWLMKFFDLIFSGYLYAI